MHELIKYCKCQSLEEREARPELTADSKALIEMLENERARARTLQVGAGRPTAAVKRLSDPPPFEE